jgi:chemotaxis family two-component system response regulator Rcp1
LSQLAKAPVYTVLIVDDNPGDTDLVLEILGGSARRVRCVAARDAAEAMRLLRAGLRPSLILLDLTLPGRGGLPLLAELKSDPRLQHIPVVVFTSSEAERDLLEVYQLQANCLLNKPVDLHEFEQVIRGVEEFWLGTVRLPPP